MIGGATTTIPQPNPYNAEIPLCQSWRPIFFFQFEIINDLVRYSNEKLTETFMISNWVYVH